MKNSKARKIAFVLVCVLTMTSFVLCAGAKPPEMLVVRVEALGAEGITPLNTFKTPVTRGQEIPMYRLQWVPDGVYWISVGSAGDEVSGQTALPRPATALSCALINAAPAWKVKAAARPWPQPASTAAESGAPALKLACKRSAQRVPQMLFVDVIIADAGSPGGQPFARLVLQLGPSPAFFAGR
ncbi:MAG: hypothetical protein LBJ38_03780 [Oscillospiraceae bacterium]|nr:hypothetical protein [Oscillospiraceae bacterium]